MDVRITWEFGVPSSQVGVEWFDTPTPGQVPLGASMARYDSAFEIGAGMLRVRRDVAGRYPWVWTRTHRALVVASSPALLPPAPIDWTAWQAWLEGTEPSEPRDFYIDRFRIRPRETVTWSAPERPPNSQWPAFERDDSVDVERCFEELKDAVRSAVPTGGEHAFLLSDGLDSSLLVALHGGGAMTATMTSACPEVTRLPLVERVRAAWAARGMEVNIDAWLPFVVSNPWHEPTFAAMGPIVYPGLAYEIPFVRAVASHWGVSRIVSGVGADQIFDRNPFQLWHWGRASHDAGAVAQAAVWLGPRAVAGQELARHAVYRKWRLPRPTTWDEPGAFLTSPSFSRANPFVLDSWEWEAAMRSLRGLELATGVSVVLPYVDGAVLDVVANYSHVVHAVGPHKPMLRRLADGLLPAEVLSAPKSTSFSPVVEMAWGRLSREDIHRRLAPLGPILEVPAALKAWSGSSALMRQARYLVAGDVASHQAFR